MRKVVESIQATVNVTPTGARRIQCPLCGAEYSTTVGDYFWARAGYAFICEHDEDERIPCDLVEQVMVTVQATKVRSASIHATGWRTVKEAATIEDLEESGDN